MDVASSMFGLPGTPPRPQRHCRRLRMPHWTKKQQQQGMRKSGSSTVMQLENLLFVFFNEKLYNQIHNSTFLGGNIPSVHHHSGFLNVISTPSL